MCYCYILACSDGTLYTGWTKDVARRLKQHNRGTGSRYTRTRRPVDLVYIEEMADRATAMQRERQIKALARKYKVELVRKSNTITKEFLETISQRKG